MTAREDIQDRVIGKAREELAEDGVVSVGTYIQLNQVGLIADTIIDQLESGEL